MDNGLYLKGSRAVKPAMEEAVLWLGLAAHNSYSGRELYEYYEISDSDDEAMMWLELAAECGVAGARERLGDKAVNNEVRRSSKWCSRQG